MPKIIDTHLHLWDPKHLNYPWLADVPAIGGTHLLADYNRATANTPIDKMVFVQCETVPEQCLDEAQWVSDLAKTDTRIQGIVALAPLEDPRKGRETLDTLTQDPLVKGIRRIIQFEDDPQFCLQPNFIQGVQLLAQYGLSFDLCLKGPQQFESTLALVGQCPQVPFILDHIGKPFIKEKQMAPWDQHMRQLAEHPNVHCKMSGLITEADTEAWQVDDLRPYFDHTMDCFGIDRVIFGGDWPVCTLAGTYASWIDAFTTLTASYSDDERHKLFYANAERFYRLGGVESLIADR